MGVIAAMAHRSVSQFPAPDPDRELPTGETRAINPQWNQAAAQVGTALGRAVNRVREMPRRAEQVAEEVSNELRERFEEVRSGEQPARVAARVREKAEQTAGELKTRARENVQVARNRAERLLRERPLEMIVAAFATAFIFGIGLRIWRSHRA